MVTAVSCLSNASKWQLRRGAYIKGSLSEFLSLWDKRLFFLFFFLGGGGCSRFRFRSFFKVKPDSDWINSCFVSAPYYRLFTLIFVENTWSEMFHACVCVAKLLLRDRGPHTDDIRVDMSKRSCWPSIFALSSTEYQVNRMLWCQKLSTWLFFISFDRCLHKTKFKNGIISGQ